MTEPWAPWQLDVWLRSQRYAAHAAHETQRELVTAARQEIRVDVSFLELSAAGCFANAPGGALFSGARVA